MTPKQLAEALSDPALDALRKRNEERAREAARLLGAKLATHPANATRRLRSPPPPPVLLIQRRLMPIPAPSSAFGGLA